MLRILLIDDLEDSVTPAKERLEANFGEECLCRIKPFKEAMDQIRSFRPHVVVLDWWNGDPQDQDDLGNTVLNRIWTQQFCPVVVYSALPPDQIQFTHPFVHKVRKGAQSLEKIVQIIEKLRIHIDILRKGEESVWDAFATAMKTVAPIAVQLPQEESKGIIARAGRRRVAALMDEPLPSDRALACWEQYLWPPVDKELLLGDILRVVDGNADDPNGFRLVLTPSCDMVGAWANENPKAKDILVAKCCSPLNGLDAIGLAPQTKQRKLKERLENHPLASQGFFQSVLLLPPLQGHIPSMMANLRALELIPVTHINEYCRVASLDSPFRESVAWAYLQCAGRPGLPDRNLQPWFDDMWSDHHDCNP